MNVKFIEIPFIPKGKVTTMIADKRISPKMEHNLRGLGIDIIKTPFCKELYPAISHHPDILLHPINLDTIIIAPNVYDQLMPELTSRGFRIIKGSTVLTRNYPGNIAYNIGRIGKYVLHNFKYTDKRALTLLDEQGLDFINVKQGYSKCSICIINSNAVITSDKGIEKELNKKGIEVLLIAEGYIDLPGLSYGFIGGASGLIDKDKIIFSGQLCHHPDYKKILDFLAYCKITPIFLDNCNPVDLGSFIPILQMEQ